MRSTRIYYCFKLKGQALAEYALPLALIVIATLAIIASTNIHQLAGQWFASASGSEHGGTGGTLQTMAMTENVAGGVSDGGEFRLLGGGANGPGSGPIGPGGDPFRTNPTDIETGGDDGNVDSDGDGVPDHVQNHPMYQASQETGYPDLSVAIALANHEHLVGQATLDNEALLTGDSTVDPDNEAIVAAISDMPGLIQEMIDSNIPPEHRARIFEIATSALADTLAVNGTLTALGFAFDEGQIAAIADTLGRYGDAISSDGVMTDAEIELLASLFGLTPDEMESFIDGDMTYEEVMEARGISADTLAACKNDPNCGDEIDERTGELGQILMDAANEERDRLLAQCPHGNNGTFSFANPAASCSQPPPEEEEEEEDEPRCPPGQTWSDFVGFCY